MMNQRIPLYCLAVIALCLFAIPPLLPAATLDEGKQAYSDKRYKDALRIWAPLAEDDNMVAQFYLSVLYAKGEGVDHSPKKSIDWLTRSAKAGYPPAQFNLGNQYFNGSFVKVDEQKAFNWWMTAARNGFPPAQYNVGKMFANGRIVSRDREKAIYWYSKAAEGGARKAQVALNKMGVTGGQAQSGDTASASAMPEQTGTSDSATVPDSAAEQAKHQTEPPKQPRKKAVTAVTGQQSQHGMSALAADVAWLNAQPATNYTVQLYSTKQHDSAAAFVKQHASAYTTRIIPIQIKGKDWFTVVAGSYTRKEDANAAIKKLPSALSRLKPWARPVSNLQRYIVNP